jgi:hypothetical protein
MIPHSRSWHNSGKIRSFALQDFKVLKAQVLLLQGIISVSLHSM